MRLGPGTRSTASVAFLFLLCFTARRGSAQLPEPGTRVRVRPATCVDAAGSPPTACPATVGTLVAREGDSLVVETASQGRRAIALGSGTRIEVSAGEHGHFLTGLLGGAVAGLIGGEIAASGDGGCSSGLGGGDLCPIYDIIGIPIGAVAGGIVGANIRSERWRPVSEDVRLMVVPRRDRTVIGLATRF